MTTFTRSLQALQRDSRSQHFVTYLILLVLLAGWVIWFSIAPIPQYVQTDQARFVSDERLELLLSQASLSQVKRGQTAHLHLDQYLRTQTNGLTAVIVRINPTLTDGKYSAELQITNVPDRLVLQRGLQGSAQIEVGQKTALQLILQQLTE